MKKNTAKTKELSPKNRNTKLLGTYFPSRKKVPDWTQTYIPLLSKTYDFDQYYANDINHSY